jgi:methionine sulfoxide reductase heme-binding subunit
MAAAAPSVTTSRPYVWLKPGVLVGALLPLALLISDALRGRLGADPVAIALNKLGLLALILLLACLAATPLRLLFGVAWPIRIRKLLGLLAFFYASLHFLLYAIIDQGLDLGAFVADVTERKFISVGFVAFVLLVPLALTSTAKMLKRLGALRWKRLHRLIYVSGVLACIHFVWRVKRDLSQPTLYATVLIVLLAIRLLELKRRKRPAQVRGAM